ncbi:MAG: hypothetical protein NWE76_10735 [Candidatus Bathyarchaeota archaeon]|nr:hypothetical protein [Candidatus Bathyarchaeota archaeon]
MEYKKLHIRIPKPLWEQLYHIFPERRGIQTFIHECFRLAVQLGRGHRFIEKLRERIEGDG